MINSYNSFNYSAVSNRTNIGFKSQKPPTIEQLQERNKKAENAIIADFLIGNLINEKPNYTEGNYKAAAERIALLSNTEGLKPKINQAIRKYLEELGEIEAGSKMANAITPFIGQIITKMNHD